MPVSPSESLINDRNTAVPAARMGTRLALVLGQRATSCKEPIPAGSTSPHADRREAAERPIFPPVRVHCRNAWRRSRGCRAVQPANGMCTQKTSPAAHRPHGGAGPAEGRPMCSRSTADYAIWRRSGSRNTADTPDSGIVVNAPCHAVRGAERSGIYTTPGRTEAHTGHRAGTASPPHRDLQDQVAVNAPVRILELSTQRNPIAG